MKMKVKLVVIIDLKFFSLLKLDGVYKKGISLTGPQFLSINHISSIVYSVTSVTTGDFFLLILLLEFWCNPMQLDVP